MRTIYFCAKTNDVIEDLSCNRTLEEIEKEYGKCECMKIDDSLYTYTVANGTIELVKFSDIAEESQKRRDQETLIDRELRQIAIDSLKAKGKI